MILTLVELQMTFLKNTYFFLALLRGQVQATLGDEPWVSPLRNTVAAWEVSVPDEVEVGSTPSFVAERNTLQHYSMLIKEDGKNSMLKVTCYPLRGLQ